MNKLFYKYYVYLVSDRNSNLIKLGKGRKSPTLRRRRRLSLLRCMQEQRLDERIKLTLESEISLLHSSYFVFLCPSLFTWVYFVSLFLHFIFTLVLHAL